MTALRLLSILLVSALFVNCTSGTSSLQAGNSKPAPGKHKTSSKAQAGASSQSSGYPEQSENTENVFRRYDAVKKGLEQWNQAISEHKPAELEKLYADEVSYYSKNLPKKAVIAQKMEWLKKHPSYRQEIGEREIYYSDLDTLGLEFVAYFVKHCIENGRKSSVGSYLYFRKFGKHWKIVRETDAVTEINVARKKKPGNLPAGKYEYYLGYWQDTRDIPDFAHENVPYNATLNLDISSEGITGVYNWYSGTARSRTYYLVKSGKLENGILELEMVYSQSDDPVPEDLIGNEETETWRFKILGDKQLVCLSEENSFLYARSMSLYE